MYCVVPKVLTSGLSSRGQMFSISLHVDPLSSSGLDLLGILYRLLPAADSAVPVSSLRLLLLVRRISEAGGERGLCPRPPVLGGLGLEWPCWPLILSAISSASLSPDSSMSLADWFSSPPRFSSESIRC